MESDPTPQPEPPGAPRRLAWASRKSTAAARKLSNSVIGPCYTPSKRACRPAVQRSARRRSLESREGPSEGHPRRDDAGLVVGTTDDLQAHGKTLHKPGRHRQSRPSQPIEHEGVARPRRNEAAVRVLG